MLPFSSRGIISSQHPWDETLGGEILFNAFHVCGSHVFLQKEDSTAKTFLPVVQALWCGSGYVRSVWSWNVRLSLVWKRAAATRAAQQRPQICRESAADLSYTSVKTQITDKCRLSFSFPRAPTNIDVNVRCWYHPHILFPPHTTKRHAFWRTLVSLRLHEVQQKTFLPRRKFCVQILLSWQNCIIDNLKVLIYLTANRREERMSDSNLENMNVLKK